MSFYAYMLRCSDGSYYVGHTDELEVRLAQHERGELPGYTEKRRPVTLVWSETFPTRDEAFAAERRIKGWSRAKKEALIAGDWALISELARKGVLRYAASTGSAATQDERALRYAASTGSAATQDEREELVKGGLGGGAEGPQGADHTDAHTCLNCGAAVVSPFCGQCGQKVHVHRSLGAIGHDLAHGILHLDGKFWRTLPLLAWRPGELTRRYVHGERAKFVSPLGMFLFAVFLMFAVLSVYGLSLASLDLDSNPARQGLETARTEVVRQLGEARARRAAFARGETVRGEDGRPATAADLDREIADAEERVAAIEGLSTGSGELNIVDPQLTSTGWARLDKGLRKLNENPGLALYKIQANGYKFSWLLIPLSVPFVWVLFFWTRRFRLYDHSVFVTYSLAFMTLFGALLTILGFAGVGIPILGTLGTFVPAIHMYRQLKQAYRLGWFGALVRTFLLLNFCFVTASLFFVLLLGIGALG